MQLSEKSKKPYVALIIILALVFVAILVTLAIILGSGFKKYSKASLPTATPAAKTATQPKASPTSKVDPTSTPEPTTSSEPEEPEPTPTSAPTLDPTTEAILDKIESEVSQVRGLTMEEKLPRHVLTPEELRKYVEEDMFEDFDEMESKEDLRHYALLGLFERDMDLRKTYEDLYSEQIAGFYEIEEREMYVVSGGQLGINERLTHAHEYIHALQYANYDFENDLDYSEETCKKDSERCLAIQALIEGDATVSQFKWLEHFGTRKDFQDLIASMEEQESPALDAAPPYLVSSMMFPYDQGGLFVNYLYETGGYEAIDQAFKNTPPVSSEQIMFPERYPDDLPIKVDLPAGVNSLDEGWQIDEDGVVGVWDTFMMLTKGLNTSFQLDEETATSAVEGWGGDAYAFLSNKDLDEYLFVMKTAWDTEKDSQEAYDAFTKLLQLRLGWPTGDGVFGKDNYFARLLKTDDGGFLLIIAESLESLDLVYQNLAE